MEALINLREPGNLNPISHGVKVDSPSHGGGSYYDHRLKNIFPDRFMVVSFHILIVLYIRTSHAKGIVSSFKTLDLMAFQKLSLKAQKTPASKFIKGKLKKKWRATHFEGPPNKTQSS